MAYYDRRNIQQFPYNGKIYKIETDDSLPPSAPDAEFEVVILQTKCNIQQSTANVNSGLINASFDIFFEFDFEKYKEENIDIDNPNAEIPYPIKGGLKFKGDMQGMDVSGEIIGIIPGQMNKVVIYIKDLEV